jgi:capsular polysaccharide biosynthesis protein
VPYRDYLAVLRRRWWIVPLVALVAVTGAWLVSRGQAPQFRSTTRLLVTPGRPDLGQQLTVEKQLRPMAQRVKTTDLARLVDEAERLDLGAEQILSRVRAEAVIDQGFVQIDVDDSDPRRAERIAGAFAQLFAQQHAAADVGRPQAERLNVEVLDRPSPASQVWPRTSALLLAAGLIGLLGGILLAFGIEYMDDTLKTADDIQRLLGLSTLGRIPRVSARPGEVVGDASPIAPGERRHAS